MEYAREEFIDNGLHSRLFEISIFRICFYKICRKKINSINAKSYSLLKGFFITSSQSFNNIFFFIATSVFIDIFYYYLFFFCLCVPLFLPSEQQFSPYWNINLKACNHWLGKKEIFACEKKKRKEKKSNNQFAWEIDKKRINEIQQKVHIEVFFFLSFFL